MMSSDKSGMADISDEARFPRSNYIYQSQQMMGQRSRELVPTEEPFRDLKHILKDVSRTQAAGLATTRLRNGFLIIRRGRDGVVYTEDGQLINKTSEFADITVQKTIDPQTKNAAVKISGSFFLGIDPGWGNYFHWLCMSVSRMLFYKHSFGGKDRILIAPYRDENVDRNFSTRFSRQVWWESLGHFNLEESTKILEDGVYQIDELEIMWSTHSFVLYLELFYSMFRLFPPTECKAGVRGTRIVIGRKDDDRLTEKGHAVLSLLMRSGFEIVQLEALSFHDQLRIFQHAEIVVAPHGAGLTNILFGTPNLKVIELNSELYGENFLRPWFYLMANGMKQCYQYLNITQDEFDPDYVVNRILGD